MSYVFMHARVCLRARVRVSVCLEGKDGGGIYVLMDIRACERECV